MILVLPIVLGHFLRPIEQQPAGVLRSAESASAAVDQGAPAVKPVISASAPAAQGEVPEPVVTAIFTDQDIKTALNEIGVGSKITIAVDDSLKPQNLSLEFKNTPISQVLNKLSAMTGFYWKQKNGVYLVSMATPDAAFYLEFATGKRYSCQFVDVESITGLLPLAFKNYVSSDKATNSLNVFGPTRVVEQIYVEIAKLDMPPRQFTLEALVAEVTYTGGSSFGFSWNYKKFSGAADQALGYTSTATAADVANLKALIESGKATLRANPRLSGVEGKLATMSVGQDTYYSILTGNSQYPTSQIQLIKTGITLMYQGWVAADGTITLKLDPEVSDSVVNVSGNPTTNVRRASTTVRVKPDQVIVIAGLIQESKSRQVSKVPFLGEIPLIGLLFQNSTTKTQKKETIIMITPHLVTEEGDLKKPLKTGG